MPGQKEFQKITSISANPGMRIRYVNLGNQGVLLAGQSLINDLYAPAGYVSKIISGDFSYGVVAAATTGTINFQMLVSSGNVGLMQMFTAFNKQLVYKYGEINSADSQFPLDKTAQQRIFDSAYFDEINFLRIRFDNNTNATDAGINKKCDLWILDQKVT